MLSGSQHTKKDKYHSSSKKSKKRIEYRNIIIDRDPILQLAQDSLASNEWSSVFRNHRIVQEFNPYETIMLATEDLEIRDQGNSGRCWLFAAMNDLKVFSEHFKPSLSYETQLSIPYLLFWHLMEYCGAFLEHLLSVIDQKPNEREFQYLFKMGINDGGNTAMAVHILERYGVIPEYAMPETTQSQNTGDLLLFLNRLLRTSIVKMKSKIGSKDTQMKELEEIRMETLKDCRRMLEACLGTPPAMIRIHPKYYEHSSLKHPKMMTPLDFYKSFTKKRMEIIPCIHGTHHSPGEWFYVDKSETLLGLEVREKAYMSIDIHDMEELTRQSILSKYPVYIGADVGYDFADKIGLADVGIFDASPLYHQQRISNIGILEEKDTSKDEVIGDIHNCPKLTETFYRLTKQEKIEFGIDGPNHAMLLVGFITADQKPDGEITYWVLLNSWGFESGKDGYMYISACWFRENVYFTNFQKFLFDKTTLKERYDLEPKNEDIEIIPSWEPVGQLLKLH
jgi:bleomycin hydrolase